jgi:hypothetical protein
VPRQNWRGIFVGGYVKSQVMANTNAAAAAPAVPHHAGPTSFGFLYAARGGEANRFLFISKPYVDSLRHRAEFSRRVMFAR